MSVVDDPVEDDVSDGGFADEVVPIGDGELCGDEGGPSAISFVADLEEVEPLAVGEAMSTPVVEDEELDPCEFVDEPGEPSVETRHGEVLEESGHTDIEDGAVEPCGVMFEGAGEPCFAGAGLTDQDQIVVGLEAFALGVGEDIATVEAASGIEVDILDVGLAEAQPGLSEAVCEMPVSPSSGLAVEHEGEPFLAVELGVLSLFGHVASGLGHALEAEGVHPLEGRVWQHGMSFVHR